MQGLTEFLPISSSAHLILVARFTAWSDQGLVFDIALHLGSLLAVLAYFRRELLDLAWQSLGALRKGRMNQYSTLLLNLCVATLPLGILGFLLKGWVENSLRTDMVIALATVLFGILLWLADRSVQNRPLDEQRSELDLTWRDALWIGLAQALAMIPGTSRSGITITAALFLGATREAAARFSFLLSIPAILGASIVALASFPEAREGMASLPSSAPSYANLGVAVLLAAVSAYACIHGFIRLLAKTGMTPYVIYRLLLGAGLMYISLA